MSITTAARESLAPPLDDSGSSTREGDTSNRSPDSMGSQRRETIELFTSGDPAIRLLFVEIGRRLYVIPSGSSSRWSSAALREGGCDVRRTGGPRSRHASSLVMDPTESSEVWSRFCGKYGQELCRAYFGQFPRIIVLDPERIPTPRSDYELLTEEFNARAGAYDSAVQSKPIERYLKERALEMVTVSVAGFDPLLEIGPGTGYHTLPLLRRGHRVTAVDLSDRMLHVLRRNAERDGVSEGLTLKLGRLGELASALGSVPAGYFGAAYSAFGAFNLEPKMAPAVSALARLIRPGGCLAFTSLNRPGMFPWIWEVASGKPRSALARLGETIPPDRIGYSLETYPRTPTDWDQLLSPMFRRVRSDPVSVLAPPFEAAPAIRFFGNSGTARLHRLDAALARRPWLSAAAGWVFLSYVRTDVEAPRTLIAPGSS
jgi:SAM-dependent methyltransferase